ncbi:MAG: zf-TFIIB domain-containing protein [Candidatus Wallbacteria bacterium]
MSRCPRCESNLKKKNIDGVQIDQCVKCGGIFLDDKELKRIAADFDAKGKKIIALKKQPKADVAVEKPVNCIRCRGCMDRVNFNYTSGIYIDFCPDCSSMWLDNGELEKIAAFMKENEKITDAEMEKYDQMLQKIKEEDKNRQDKNFREISSPGIFGAIVNMAYKIARKITE